MSHVTYVADKKCPLCKAKGSDLYSYPERLFWKCSKCFGEYNDDGSGEEVIKNVDV